MLYIAGVEEEQQWLSLFVDARGYDDPRSQDWVIVPERQGVQFAGSFSGITLKYVPIHRLSLALQHRL